MNFLRRLVSTQDDRDFIVSKTWISSGIHLAIASAHTMCVDAKAGFIGIGSLPVSLVILGVGFALAHDYKIRDFRPRLMCEVTLVCAVCVSLYAALMGLALFFPSTLFVSSPMITAYLMTINTWVFMYSVLSIACFYQMITEPDALNEEEEEQEQGEEDGIPGSVCERSPGK